MAESFTSTQAVGDDATAASIDNLITHEIITDSGAITITPSAANTPTSGAVTFSKTFPSTPKVFVTANTTVIGTTVTGVAVTGASTTGCTVWVTRTNTSATAVNWFAVVTQ